MDFDLLRSAAKKIVSGMPTVCDCSAQQQAAHRSQTVPSGTHGHDAVWAAQVQKIRVPVGWDGSFWFRLMGRQLITNPGCFFLGRGQLGGHSRNAPSQCPDLLDQLAWVSWLACQFPASVRGGPIDLRLLLSRAGLVAFQLRFVAVETVPAAVEHRA